MSFIVLYSRAKYVLTISHYHAFQSLINPMTSTVLDQT
jgi:hypothetical protein